MTNGIRVTGTNSLSRRVTMIIVVSFFNPSSGGDFSLLLLLSKDTRPFKLRHGEMKREKAQKMKCPKSRPCVCRVSVCTLYTYAYTCVRARIMHAPPSLSLSLKATTIARRMADWPAGWLLASCLHGQDFSLVEMFALHSKEEEKSRNGRWFVYVCT